MRTVEMLRRDCLYSKINSTTERICFVAFISMVTLEGFIHRLESNVRRDWFEWSHLKELIPSSDKSTKVGVLRVESEIIFYRN